LDAPERAAAVAEGRAEPLPKPSGLAARLSDALARVELSTLLVACGVALAVYVRARYVLAWDFPLNDGGLFYQMSLDLQRAGYRLPEVTPYNHADIPFAYPPLGFYLAAFVEDITTLSMLDVFRFLPLVVTCLTVVAFYVLARDVMRSMTVVVIAVFAFALVPRSFIWLLMGGGVTRSLGLLFAMLALHQIFLMYTRRQLRYVLAAAVLCALTALSHLQTASFLAFSSVLFFAAYGRHRDGAVYSVIVGIGTIVLTAPWWGTVINTHGIGPFLAANATGGSIFSSEEWLRRFVIDSLLRLGTTSEPLFPLIGTLALLGAIASVTKRQFLLPAWWAAIILLDARAFPTFSTVPVSMLAGVGVTDVLLPVVLRPVRERWWIRDEPDEARTFGGVSPQNALRSWAPVLFGVFLWYSVNGALLWGGEVPSLTALAPEERSAMRWAQTSTSPDSRFLIVSGISWPVDRVSEWFPVIADRVSVATPQGYEWVVGDDVFATRQTMHDHAQGCSWVDSACILEWRKLKETDFDYIYVPKPPWGQCCEHFVHSLSIDTRFRLAYDGPGATIYQYVG
jgi:hypothetical protein